MLVKGGIPSQGLANLFVCWLLILLLSNAKQGPHLTWKVSWGTRLTNGDREETLRSPLTLFHVADFFAFIQVH